MPTEVSIASIGARAAQLLTDHSDWTIAARFGRSFYVRSGDHFICIGDASIGDGPLNAVLGNGLILGLVPCISSPELKLECRTHREFCFSDGTVMMLDHAVVWRSPAWPMVAPDALAPVRLRALLKAATVAAPPTSFVHALSDEPKNEPLARRARAGVQQLHRALTGHPLKNFAAAATALLGLGHGLTPSGDDLLAGALVGLHALHRHAEAERLATAIRKNARRLTSPLSRALLEPACDGEPSAAVHRAFAALLRDGPPAEVIAPLRAVGHSSGFDMLAGMLTVAPAYAA